MTVSQAIERSSLLYPADLESGRVYSWLSELESRICAELYGEDSQPITADDAQRELKAPEAYAELYPLYIIMKTDLANGDTERYNNSAVSFKNAYTAFANYFNRTHLESGYKTIRLL
ncbi:MAG: hypothetical protein E7634_07310 [Ruminococcaceae bacterium]|nr:hypothetical protein [Oscillospiraceae bacterium]MBQ9692208.1 hypothetical protein [Clostridia bacterium]